MFGARRGVEIAADRLDLLGDVARRAPPRALERHMFEKMRQAMLVRSFVARSGPDKDAKRGGLKMRHAIGGDPQAGRQSGDLDAHDAARFDARAARARIKRSISLWSLGKIENFSFRLKRPARWPGKSGRIPVACAIASGNLAGWAVPRTTSGLSDAFAFALRAALMPTAVCGSARIARFSPALGDLLRGFGLGDAERIELGANGMKRAGLDRKPLRLPQPRH